MIAGEKTLHIMLAEDDSDEREFFEEALNSLGRNVQLDIFKNGEELLNGLFRCSEISKCPDIIFLDLNMPVVNGLEALEKIRGMKEFACVPVIAILTTSNSEQDKRLTYDRGADAFMSKPTSYRSLVGLIEKVLDIDWSTRERNLQNFIVSL